MQTEIGTNIDVAARLLSEGELVSIPTETVYGLAANAMNEDAVLKIYQVKQRPQFNPLIVHTATFEQAKAFIKYVPLKAELLAKAFWPGPLTLLLQKKDNIPDLVTAGSNRVAIRVPDHQLTLKLLQQLPFPVAAPSANPSGYVSPTSAHHVYENLNGKIPYILDGGECIVGVESTIIGWNEEGEPELYRFGGITVEALEKVLGEKINIKNQLLDNPDTPGQLKSHYATNTPLHIGKMQVLLQKYKSKKIVVINFSDYQNDVSKENQFILSPNASLEEAAKNLFRTLRLADTMHADVLLTEYLPNEGLGLAINDRLQRAQSIMKKI